MKCKRKKYAIYLNPVLSVRYMVWRYKWQWTQITKYQLQQFPNFNKQKMYTKELNQNISMYIINIAVFDHISKHREESWKYDS